ncbi:MAG: phosphoribosylformylglycinamidine synthase subunit PurL [candidate division WOR-3 bacterium]|nr:phosphoribosylformylglycinamidine synthase subunit PurL [candidate division WOR-3 bacterium]
MYRIEIRRKNDPRGKFVKEDFESIGFKGITSVEVRDVYYIYDEISYQDACYLARNLFCDPVVEEYRICAGKGFEILFNPGVTDPKEDSIKKAAMDLGIKLTNVKTGINYIFKGRFDKDRLKECAGLFLYNPLIQHIRQIGEEEFKPRAPKYSCLRISLDTDLVKLSRDMGLSLSKLEMETIKHYFEKLKRDPTDVELETIAQTWSEHCRHKTFLGKIRFGNVVINNLLKNTIMKATKEINHPLCLSVFHDNSGVIEFDEDYGVCFKVETHNHPSALEPYGGAATGIGGVIRDILGTGLGARPIMNTDVFCFGNPEINYKDLPAGILHPKRIIKGVYQGVRDYGNRMGIPTKSGAVYFDDDFLYNPLVYCGTVGLIRKDRIKKGAKPKDLILLVGGRTGRDGIHGATFSSAELSIEAEKSCVQIGNPIIEKRVLDCLLKVSELGILNSVTDCGGGGLSSAVGEMGKKIGARVYLERVPLKYKGLTPREIWISESQERMILSVPERHVKQVIEIFNREGVEATVIGEFTNNKRLILYYKNEKVCDLDMKFLHDGLPVPEKKAVMRKTIIKDIRFPMPQDLNQVLLEIVGSLNCCSREWLVREYDHEVQGASVIKPFVGVYKDGHQDGVVIRPLLHKLKGIVITCGINPSYGKYDPYNMALSVIDEALRNLVATGGDIKKAAMLDNFCFASPEREEVLGDIVLSARGCYDGARAFGVPFISGKDSLNNEYLDAEGKSHLIPPTLLISAIGIIDDVRKCITMDLKTHDSLIYLIGVTKEELGGSEYFRYLNIKGGKVPGVNLKIAPRIMERLHRAIINGLVLSCHDLSEGGLGLAISEMVMAGDIGCEIDITKLKYTGKNRRADILLFSESNTRFLVEVLPENAQKFEKFMKNIPYSAIGKTTKEKRLKIYNSKRLIIDQPIARLRARWKRKIL